MQKFRLLVEDLEEKGILDDSNRYVPGKAEAVDLEIVHDRAYIASFIDGTMDAKAIRKMGLPWSEGLVNRTLISPAGTLLTCHKALEEGLACHLAGGTHHAHRSEASGFCIFNDLAYAAKTLLGSGRVDRVLIYDLDVHQGDGTARILEEEDRAYTCSLHGEKNFPLKKAQSNLDVGLPDGINDDDYISVVENTLEQLLDEQKPDLLIYDAGVDIFKGDPLGRLGISMEGLRRRDRIVLEMARGVGVPVATVIGGGYDEDEEALAKRHAIVVEEAFAISR